MMQRLIETEQGRIKTADARRRAALMINSALEGHMVPPGISELLKGPWCDSAQLILLKFGVDSAQWAQMSATTDTLLDPVQPTGAEDSKGRQHFFDMVTRLPRELKRWLISLQHDSAAVDDAVGLVELAHLQVLRNQELELGHVTPVPVADNPGAGEDIPGVLGDMDIGQWFRIQPAKGEPMRARLVLRMDDARQLLFANHAGIKVLQLGYGEFAELLAAGSASPLDCGASFSRSLARAAGVGTLEDLMAIPGAATGQARREEQQQRLARERLQREQRVAAQEPEREAAALAAGDHGAGRGPVPVRPDLQLSMGTWLGFHDVNPPLLAKLAVHDRENDHYIFVNRSGIKLREVSGEQLQNLMDQGLLDILESRSSFRDQIAGTKGRSQGDGMVDEQRWHLRLPIESTVFVELESPPVGSGGAGKIARCKTMDVSRGGLRVSLEQELVVGAILQMAWTCPRARRPCIWPARSAGAARTWKRRIAGLPASPRSMPTTRISTAGWRCWPNGRTRGWPRHRRARCRPNTSALPHPRRFPGSGHRACCRRYLHRPPWQT